MASTVVIDGADITAGAGTITSTIIINGITITSAATALGADATLTERAIADSLATAINANVELAGYVSAAGTTVGTTGVLTVTSTGSTPIKVGNATVGAATTTALTAAPTGTLAVAATNSGVASGVLTTDTITDLNLGGVDTATAVDIFNISGVTATALTVAATSAITGADLSAAVIALFNTGGALNGTTNTVGLFTFGTDTYLIGNVGASASSFGSGTAITSVTTLENASDFIVKVTGFTGTLDASDFTFV
jgi:hypothetical protein